MDYLIFLIDLFFKVYILLVVIRALLPWLPLNRTLPPVKFVYDTTEPLLLPLREGLPPLKIGIDVAPFMAMLLLWLFDKLALAVLSLI